MKNRYTPIRMSELSQSDSGIEISGVSLSDHFAFTIVPSESATGVLEFEIKADTDSDYEFIYSAPTIKQSIDLSDGTQTFKLQGYFAESFRVTSTGVTGTYSCILQQASN